MNELFKMVELEDVFSHNKLEFSAVDESKIIILEYDNANNVVGYDEIDTTIGGLFDLLDELDEYLDDEYCINYVDDTTFGELARNVADMDATQYKTFVEIKNSLYNDYELISAYKENETLKKEIAELNEKINELKSKINNL